MGFILNLGGAEVEAIRTGRNSEDRGMMSTPEDDSDPRVFGVGGWAGLAREGDAIHMSNGLQMC